MKDKVVIVTGSTQGIGRAIVEHCAKKGANVVLTSRDKNNAQRAAAEIETNNSSVLGCEFNIEKRDGIKKLLAFTIENFGKIDVLINNALSTTIATPLHNMSDDEIEFTITANLTNTFILTREAYPYLKETKGNVINIDSISAVRHVEHMPLLSIIKSALDQTARAFASEWAHSGVRVNAVRPGFIYTNALKNLHVPDDIAAAAYQHFKQYVPLKRIGTPNDVANLVTFLASEQASYITGSIYDIDGGFSNQFAAGIGG